MTIILAPISVGEALDKLTILRLKRARLSDPKKLQNVSREIELLDRAIFRNPLGSPSLNDLIKQLSEVNERLWHIEDEIRHCERRRDFGDAFVELARSVYLANDTRAAIKRQINEITGSELVEEKSYIPY